MFSVDLSNSTSATSILLNSASSLSSNTAFVPSTSKLTYPSKAMVAFL
jgi:hypothetical protein